MSKRFGFGMVVRVAIVIAAFGVTGAIAHSSEPPAWKKALQLRGAVLEHRYARDADVRRSTRKPEPDWLKALELRSEALDHKYGLASTLRSAQGAPAAAWYEALMARSDALDRAFRLGKYAAS
jgi:hypothetical protein